MTPEEPIGAPPPRKPTTETHGAKRVRRPRNILPLTRGWVETKPDAPRPGFLHFRAFQNQCALVSSEMQRELERHEFGRAIMRVAWGHKSWDDPLDVAMVEAAWRDPDRRALIHAAATRRDEPEESRQARLAALAQWAQQHGIRDAWVPAVLFTQGGSPRLVGAAAPQDAKPTGEAPTVLTPRLIPLPDGGAIFFGADMRERRVPTPPPRRPLDPPSPLLETRKQYMERAAREWDAAISDHKARGFVKPVWKRGRAALRDFHLLAEHIVLSRSEAVLGERYFPDSDDPKDAAAKALGRTARRIGLHLHGSD